MNHIARGRSGARGERDLLVTTLVHQVLHRGVYHVEHRRWPHPNNTTAAATHTQHAELHVGFSFDTMRDLIIRHRAEDHALESAIDL